MSEWKLLIEDDVGDTTSVPLLRGVITIGRKEGNTVRLTARNVSRFHARLVNEGEQIFVEDLESYNGVRLNGDRIKGRVAVHEGDLIEIGDYHLAPQLEVAHAAGEPASVTSDLFPENTDDAFAGETQRWEPSISQLPTRDSTVPAGLDGLDTDETARMPTANGPAEANTAEESDASDPLSPGLSSLRSLAALDAEEHQTPILGLPQLGFAEPAAETDESPVSGQASAQIPPSTEPYFHAYSNPGDAPPGPAVPSTEPKGAVTPARVSLVDAPAPEAPGMPELNAASPSMPEFGDPVAELPVPTPSDPLASRDVAGSSVPPVAGPSSAPVVPPQPENVPAAIAPEELVPLSLASTAPGASGNDSLPAAAADSPLPAIETESTEAMPLAPHSQVDISLPRLVALNTVLAGASFPIEGADMVVGRVEGCDLLIQHKSVSRSHCRLVREGDAVRVIDLKSANGTLVNSVELDQAVLRSGDVLELGTVLLRFVPSGDDFSLSTEEIVRAREAEAQASEWQDDSTLTSIASPEDGKGGAASFGKIAAALGLLFVVAMLAFAVGRTSNQGAAQTGPDSANAVATDGDESETSQ